MRVLLPLVLVLGVAAVVALLVSRSAGSQRVRRAELQAALRDRAALQSTLDAVEELLLPERGTATADVVLDRIRSDERRRRALEQSTDGHL